MINIYEHNINIYEHNKEWLVIQDPAFPDQVLLDKEAAEKVHFFLGVWLQEMDNAEA